MGNLAFLGSHQINGVSALHTELMRETVFHDLHRLYPQRISNKTNGVSFRRWLFQANPGLTELLVETLGADLLDTRNGACRTSRSTSRTPGCGRASPSSAGRTRPPWRAWCWTASAWRSNRKRCSMCISSASTNTSGGCSTCCTVALYQEIRNDPTADRVPRVKIFAGKAAASYHQAKLIIKLANDIARTINDDPTVRGLLKLVFLPSYNVSLAEAIIPAADLSEQISTAGLEASGTSNMKFALNGALTIGTLDGANVEMSQRIGLEHMFIFGLSAQQVEQRRRAGELEMGGVIAASPRLEKPWRRSAAGCSRPTTAAATKGWWTAWCTTTASCSAPTSRPTGMRSAGSRKSGASPIAGGARRCSTWRGSAGSAPTGRSANTPGISGSYEGPYQKPAG